MVVEGTMTHKPSRIILCIFSLLFISQLPFVSTNSEQAMTIEVITPENIPDLLIILSPQYSNDTEIHTAINTYIAAVKNDLRWNSHLISLHEDENNYQQIDLLIETINQNHTLKACIMVGEDLNTALAGDTDYLEQPSTLPWATLGGTTAYESTVQGIIAKPTTIQICISLLYPPQTLPYEQKKESILFAFHKFTTQRHQTSHNTIRVYESSDLNTYSKTIYQQLSQHATLEYREDATTASMTSSLKTPYTAFFVHGHSNPSGTDVNAEKNSGWFPAENLNNINTPFFGADGCYTAGWWSNQKDNNKLDGSIDTTSYGSIIFTSTTIQVMALGLLSQNGFSTSVSFIENAMPELLAGKTLAEAMIGDFTIGDTIIIGDPTFHFTT